MMTFAWPSHNRPDILRRSVTSLTESLGEKTKSYRYIIAESGNTQSIPDYVPSANLLYINDAYRKNLIEEVERELAFQGLPVDTAQFALSADHAEGSEGVHRNTINLATIGETFISNDDDVIFDIKSLPSSVHKQTFAGASNFFSFKNWQEFESFESQMDSVSCSDFFSLHESLLQNVAFSSSGLRGHSIYGGPRFIFTFNDSALAAFCQNSAFIDEALASRILWNETVQVHLVPYSSVATYSIGMNNKFMLAPCFPFGRNVDGAFAYATKALNPSAQTAHVPASILHKPLYDRGAYSSLEEIEFRINDLLWLIWSEWLQTAPTTLSIEDRYALSSDYFDQIAKQSHRDFSGYLINLSQRSLLSRASNLEAQHERLKLNTSIRKSSWPGLVMREIGLCRKRASDRFLPLPLESKRDGRSYDDQLNLTQEWVQSYANMIKAWPFIRNLMSKHKSI